MSDGRPARAGRAAGFTLLELLVVLTLATALATASATLIRPRSASLDRTVADVARFLRLARQEGIVRGNTVRVEIDPATGRIGRPAGPTIVVPEGLTFAVEGGEDRPGGGIEIAFMPSGASSGATIAVSRGNATRRIEVRRLTGTIVEGTGR